MVRRSRRSRTRRGRTRRNRSRVMRGGGVKEDALAAVRASGTNGEDLLVELINKRGTTKTIGNFTFKAVGHVNLYLMAKPNDANDSKYVEVYYMSDH